MSELAAYLGRRKSSRGLTHSSKRRRYERLAMGGDTSPNVVASLLGGRKSDIKSFSSVSDETAADRTLDATDNAVKPSTAFKAPPVSSSPLPLALPAQVQSRSRAQEIEASARRAAECAVWALKETGGLKAWTPQAKRVERLVNLLFRCEVLKQESKRTYAFYVPKLGLFMQAIRKGRSELLGRLKRCRFKEQLRLQLEKTPLRSSPLSIRMLILDLMGKQLLKQVPTTSGDLIQLRGQMKGGRIVYS
eukprot:GHVT01071503.1.p1 GENE.GHVT01071503.1~~GHVT01071503.1.p1  ORF type:complete len:248 (-),score=30.98 GHVT01071503.1:15-758(-)